MSGPATPTSAAARAPYVRRVGPGAQPLATLLGSAAVLASALPIGHLFTATPWSAVALLQVAVVAAVGLGLRAAGRGSSVVALGQLLGVLVVQSVAFSPADAALGGLLPTPATLAHWRDLGAEAARTIMENAAPAPAPTGIAFVVSAAVALVAWAVDVVSVGSRMPAVAGLPLLTPFLTAVANGSAALPWQDGALPLALWAVMMMEQERDWLASWRPDLAGAHRLPARGRRLAGGAALVAVALVAGFGLAAVAPHLPQRYLADGLGRGDLARGHRVGFSPNSDLLLDLTSGDMSPVLTYTSDDPDLPPLRVSVATTYADAKWAPAPVSVTPSTQPQLPQPPGLGEAVDRKEVGFRVDQTGLAAPYVAAPVPLVAGSVMGARWAVDPRTGVPVVDVTPRSYDLRYLALSPTPAQLREASPTRRTARDTTAIPGDVDTPLLHQATAQAVGDARTPYDAAVAIQDWLRGGGGFTYSLELAPAPAGMSEAQAKATALDRFLQTKRGYCVQFASAMVMMARLQGIPARVATGFLPGRADPAGEGPARRVVVASDAHAWPELYFEGAGWLRFEPTPSQRSGPAPRWATGTSGGSAATTSTTTVTATQTVTASAPPSSDRRDVDAANDAGAGDAPESPWWPLLRLVAGAGVLLSIVPAVAAAVRARRRARAADAGQAAEAEWSILSEQLADLGVDVPAAATPRQTHARVTDTAVLDRDASRALQRIMASVEDARYAPPGTGTGQDGDEAARRLREDARSVRVGAASLRSAPTRARAALLPRAGLRALRLPVPGRRTPPPRH